MHKIELQPLETNQPGCGQLVIIGWQGTSEGASLDIQRNQDEHFLQNDGAWRSNAFRLHLPALQHTAEGHLSAMVDNKIVDPILESPHATYMVRFYGADSAQVGRARLRIGQGLMSSGASGTSPDYNASATLDTPPLVSAAPEAQPSTEPAVAPQPVVEHLPEQEPAPAQPEPVTAQPEPAPTGKSRRWLWILLAVLILTAILGATAWFAMTMRSQAEPPAEDSAVEERLEEEGAAEDETASIEAPLPNHDSADEARGETAPEAPADAEPAPSETAAAVGPCSLQRMSEMGELEFMQTCVDSEAGNMLEVIGEARDNDHCGIARRLYAHQALNGDVAAALAYAREFDPAQHAPSACFPEPDAETAIFWYETALALDPANAEASLRVEELQ